MIKNILDIYVVESFRAYSKVYYPINKKHSSLLILTNNISNIDDNDNYSHIIKLDSLNKINEVTTYLNDMINLHKITNIYISDLMFNLYTYKILEKINKNKKIEITLIDPEIFFYKSLNIISFLKWLKLTLIYRAKINIYRRDNLSWCYSFFIKYHKVINIKPKKYFDVKNKLIILVPAVRTLRGRSDIIFRKNYIIFISNFLKKIPIKHHKNIQLKFHPNCTIVEKKLLSSFINKLHIMKNLPFENYKFINCMVLNFNSSIQLKNSRVLSLAGLFYPTKWSQLIYGEDINNVNILHSKVIDYLHEIS